MSTPNIIPKISDDLQEDLLLRLVRKNGNLKNVLQGVDHHLFLAFEAWSTLMALHDSKVKVQGLLRAALYQGNAHIIIISMGKLIDRRGDQSCSFKGIWEEFAKYLDDTPEKEIIHKNLYHPKGHKYLKEIIYLRNKVYAHNSETRVDIELHKLEDTLHFCFRTWSLFDGLLHETPNTESFRRFKDEDWKLKEIFNRKEYDAFHRSWNNSKEKAQNWITKEITE